MAVTIAPPEAHQHEGCKRKHSSRDNGYWCHCAGPKAFECQACSRNRQIREGIK